MAPKRRLDERRKIQNREAQRRFRERAKQRLGMQKDNNHNNDDGVVINHAEMKRNKTYTQKRNNKRHSDTSSLSSSSSQDRHFESQQQQLLLSDENVLLQNALMTSCTDHLDQPSQQWRRYEDDQLYQQQNQQYTSFDVPPIPSNPGLTTIHDSKSPSASSSSAASSSHPPTSTIVNWIGLPYEAPNTEEYSSSSSVLQAEPPNIIQMPVVNWTQMMDQVVNFSPFQVDQQQQQYDQQQSSPVQQSALFTTNFPLNEPNKEVLLMQNNKQGSCNGEIEKWQKSMNNEPFNRFFNGLA